MLRRSVVAGMSLTIASYGGGTNSTAEIIECVWRGIALDLITFADTGGEKPHTYAYVEMFSKWLVEQGYPAITIVKPNITLEQDCINRHALPSLAYGFKTCSQRFKVAPQEKFVNNWQPAIDAWERGELITKMIGFDADEPHRAVPYQNEKYMNWYPLIEWDMGRAECIKTILDAGLCLPGKSACYYCPSSSKSEIKWLQHNYPDLFKRACAMEANAELTSVKGLGRDFSWRDLGRQIGMMDEEYSRTPELVCECYDGGDL